MPIAAVPNYLGNDFKDASPGLRFGMYLPLWGINQRTKEKLWTTHDINYRPAGKDKQQHEFKDETKAVALNQATALNPIDKATAKAFLARQQTAFNLTVAQARLCLSATSIAPFSTGLGYEHPLENGFAFLNPYGLPYLPASGIKGVLRQAARELASGNWGASAWNNEKRHVPPGTSTCNISKLELSDVDVLFGLDSEAEHFKGVLSFWDVLPQIKSDQLMVEIMTPHQSHYYQGNTNKIDNKKSAGSTSPHDSGSPNPIFFLTVPPESEFLFHVTCNVARLEWIAPDLAHSERWKLLLREVFEHAFKWLGFGAKTAVGYGAMQRDEVADNKRSAAEAEQLAQQQEQTRLAQMTEPMRQVVEFEKICQQREQELKGKKDKPNTALHDKARNLAKIAHEASQWTAEEKCLAANVIETWLPKVVSVDIKDERKKMKLNALKGQG